MKRRFSLLIIAATFFASLAGSLLAPTQQISAAPNYDVQWGNSVGGVKGGSAPALSLSQISTALQSGATFAGNKEIDLNIGGTVIKFLDSSACKSGTDCQFQASNYGCGGSNSFFDIQLGNQGHENLYFAAVKQGGNPKTCYQVMTGAPGSTSASSGNSALPVTITNSKVIPTPSAPQYPIQWTDQTYGVQGGPAPAMSLAQISSAMKSGAKWVNNQEIDVSIAGTTIKFLDSTACPTNGSSDCEFDAQNYGCFGAPVSGTNNQPNTWIDVNLKSAASGNLLLAAVKPGGNPKTCVQLMTNSGSDELPLTLVNTSASSTAAASQGSNDPTANCEASPGGFGWLLCKVGYYLGSAEQSIEGYVDTLLKTQPLNFNAAQACTQTNSGCSSNDAFSAKVYAVWNNFRIYGNIVLVIALLVIVFGEAIGGGVIDAYTVKKVLPRILIAAILINLSIYFVAIIEDVFNVIGGGIQYLLEKPFQITPGVFSIHIAGGTGAIGTVTLVGLLAYGILSPGVLIFLLTVIGLGLLAALAILITLMLRQVIIVLLLIFAPVAFALYCLPNTEQYFKKWWGLLIKTLMVYPIVSVVFAASQIAGVVISNMDITATGNIMAQLIAFLAMIIPLFLIPFAFKMSGGVIGQITGAVSNLRKTASAPLTNMYKKRSSERIQQFRKKGVYSGNSRRARFGNAVGGWMFDADEKIPLKGRNFAPFRKRGQQLYAGLEHESLEESQKVLETVNKTFNDKAYRAINGGLHGGLTAATQEKFREKGLLGKTPQSVEDYLAMAEILRESDDQTERLAGGAIEGSAGMLATLNKNPELANANVAAVGLMGLAAHGFITRKDVNAATHAIKVSGGAVGEGLAQGAGVQAQLLASKSRPDLKAGYGMDWNREIGEYEDGLNTNGGLRGQEWLSTIGPQDLAGAKGGLFKTEAEGGSGDILLYALRTGGNQQLVAQNQAKISAALNGKSLDEQKRIRAQWKNTAEGQEMLKIELAAKNYDAVKKVLLQNAGNWAHGAVDVQSESARILRDAGLEKELERTQTTPEAVAAEGGVPGDPQEPPGTGTGSVFGG